MRYDVCEYLRVGTCGAVVVGVDLDGTGIDIMNIWEFGFGQFNYDIEWAQCTRVAV